MIVSGSSLWLEVASFHPAMSGFVYLSWLTEKGMTEDEMAGWHHWPDGHESEWTPGVGDGQGEAWRAAIHGVAELDKTEQLSWTELNL